MIAYQKCHLLSLQSDTSDSCSDENFDSIPKMFAKASTKELHQIKVENFMAEYSKEKWTDKDYKLLNGVFNREKLSQEQIETLMNHMDYANIYQGINERISINSAEAPPEESKRSDPSFDFQHTNPSSSLKKKTSGGPKLHTRIRSSKSPAPMKFKD